MVPGPVFDDTCTKIGDVGADGIVRQAEVEAELERKRVNETIKEQIVDVSTALAENIPAKVNRIIKFNFCNFII